MPKLVIRHVFMRLVAIRHIVVDFLSSSPTGVLSVVEYDYFGIRYK